MTVIPIGRINDGPSDFQVLCGIWQKAMSANDDIAFEFHYCDFLRPNALVFLGGLARVLQLRGRMVDFRWQTLQNNWVQTNLAQSGFLYEFGGQEGPWKGNSIPFRVDGIQDAAAFEHYLGEYWLGRGWIGVSAGLRDQIVSRVAELYMNAFQHSRSPIGIMVCGQYFKKRNELTLALADFGVGIPSNVRAFRGPGAAAATDSAAACMQWAFARGNSTAQTPGISRGVGLDILREFVQAARGSLDIYSHDGGYRLVDKQETFATLRAHFEGTLVNIRLQCDDTYYVLASENVSVVPF
jgi:hypothetical protein